MHDAPPDDSPPSSQAAAVSSPDAFQKLFSQVYTELRAIAQRRISAERPGQTLHATELVHEVYLRLFGADGARIDYANRAHFFHVVAEAMRHILIDHARRRGRAKHGGDRERVTVDLAELALPVDADNFLAVDEAFQRLEAKDARAAEVVRLRFYAGLSVEQTAEAMRISPRSVAREWAFARAWLLHCLA
jgi:RNA polymerase sigma factor (TIGR02999 family)